MPIGEPTIPTQGKEFDPHNPQYEKVSDLPIEQRKKFVDVESGFVTKEAEASEREYAQSADDENKKIPFYKRPFIRKLVSEDVALEDATKNREVYEAGMESDGKQGFVESSTRMDVTMVDGHADAEFNVNEAVGRETESNIRERIKELAKKRDELLSKKAEIENFLSTLRGAYRKGYKSLDNYAEKKHMQC
jgi:hypothetical protein